MPQRDFEAILLSVLRVFSFFSLLSSLLFVRSLAIFFSSLRSEIAMQSVMEKYYETFIIAFSFSAGTQYCSVIAVR